MGETGDLEARLAAVRGAFVADLPNRAAALRAAWDAVQTTEGRAEFHRLVHSLSGSGATFGFPDLSAHARALEERLQSRLQGDVPGDHARISTLFTALLAAITVAAASAPGGVSGNRIRLK